MDFVFDLPYAQPHPRMPTKWPARRRDKIGLGNDPLR
jgi:hypothetical protein